jgi:hypothetical protein
MHWERSSRQLRETGECGRIRRVNGAGQDQTSDRRAEGVDGQVQKWILPSKAAVETLSNWPSSFILQTVLDLRLPLAGPSLA